VPAGTLDWWRAWAFLGAVSSRPAATMLAVNEALVATLQAADPEGQPTSDRDHAALHRRVLGLYEFIPLDVFRLQLLPNRPRGLVPGSVVFLAAGRRDARASRKRLCCFVVRHQKERRQRVIDTGLYGVVRQPMYSGSLPLLSACRSGWNRMPVLCWWSYPTAVLLARIAVEEESSDESSKATDEYMRRVRYRLIPSCGSEERPRWP